MTRWTEISRAQGYVSMSDEAQIKVVEVVGEQFCMAIKIFVV